MSSVLEQKLLCAEEVAKILSVSKWRVYDLIQDGLLPAVHLGKQVRVRPDVLEKWIEQGGSRLPDNSESAKQSPRI